MNAALKVLAGLAGAVVVAALASNPPPLDHAPDVSTASLDELVRDDQPGIIPGTEKRLLWYAGKDVTPWSVVYLHGFSASRQEAAPLAEMVAESLGANLFETRFRGHGLVTNGLSNVRAEEWLDDTAEALTVGGLIGDRIVVIAVSTGATLLLSLLDHPAIDTVDSLVLVSPNFAPADPGTRWITRPGGPLLLRLLAGETRTWEAYNEQQERFWTTSYPSKTVIQVMRAVDRAEERISTHSLPRVQIFYSPDDKVISVDALLAAYARIDAPEKELVPIMDVAEPSAHMIVGDIISPQNNAPVASRIAEFILRRAR